MRHSAHRVPSPTVAPKMFEGAKQWRRARRREVGARKNRDAPLREFVYLDETSVFSLMVSRVGPVASEFTDTESDSLRAEAASSVGASAGLIKADVRAGVEATRGASTQVVRRAMIQSTFRDLHRFERGRLLLSSGGPERQALARVSDVADLARGIPGLLKSGWLIDPNTLQRGQLIELEVELETETIYKLSTTLTTLLDFVTAHPEMVAAGDREGIEVGKAAQTVFDRMLVGLVPVRGRAIDYSIIAVDGRDWIAHTDLLATLPAEVRSLARDFHVVGVAEADLFWKDIRRVLFSRSRFTVMARISHAGLSADWRPAKLVDVLNEFFPDLVTSLEGMIEAGVTSLAEESQSPTSAAVVRAATRSYVTALGEVHQQPITAEALEALELPDLERCGAATDVVALRALFADLTAVVDERLQRSTAPEVASQVRDAELLKAGIGPDGALVRDTEDESAPQMTTPRREALLDTEIVAIYW